MTPEDRAEVERIALNSAKGQTGLLAAIFCVAMLLFLYKVMTPTLDRITALEAQVRELQGGKP